MKKFQVFTLFRAVETLQCRKRRTVYCQQLQISSMSAGTLFSFVIVIFLFYCSPPGTLPAILKTTILFLSAVSGTATGCCGVWHDRYVLVRVISVSVPGGVGDVAGDTFKGFAAMQVTIGYFSFCIKIAFVLLPLYYRLNLTSIYNYLCSVLAMGV